MTTKQSILLTSLCVILHTMCAHAKTVYDAMHSNHIAQLLIVDSQTLLGDPLALTLLVTNVDDEAIAVINPAIEQPWAITLDVFLRFPGSNSYSRVILPGLYDGPWKSFSKEPPLPTTLLTNSQSVAFTVVLDYCSSNARREGLVFPYPGRYDLKARCYVTTNVAASQTSISADVDRQMVETMPISVEIIEGNKVDREALSDVDNEVARCLYRPWTTVGVYNTNQVNSVLHAQFLKRHNSSRFARYSELSSLHAVFATAIASKDSRAMKSVYKRVKDISNDATWPAGWRYTAQRMLKRFDGYGQDLGKE